MEILFRTQDDQSKDYQSDKIFLSDYFFTTQPALEELVLGLHKTAPKLAGKDCAFLLFRDNGECLFTGKIENEKVHLNEEFCAKN